jgi:hypothetical protein
MQTNCPAYVKVFTNSKLKTVRVLATFDTSRRNKNGQIVVTVQNAVFASGDVATMQQSEESRAQSVANTLDLVRAQLRTSNLVLI